MNHATSFLGTIGYAVAALCFGAYVWGYIFKVRAFRPLSVVALFLTIFAMAQLAMVLNGFGGQTNVVYAMICLIVSGLAQSYNALIGRHDGQARGGDGAGET
jgi:hypothetical protein